MKKMFIFLFVLIFINACATLGIDVAGKFDKESAKNI